MIVHVFIAKLTHLSNNWVNSESQNNAINRNEQETFSQSSKNLTCKIFLIQRWNKMLFLYATNRAKHVF